MIAARIKELGALVEMSEKVRETIVLLGDHTWSARYALSLSKEELVKGNRVVSGTVQFPIKDGKLLRDLEAAIVDYLDRLERSIEEA